MVRPVYGFGRGSCFFVVDLSKQRCRVRCYLVCCVGYFVVLVVVLVVVT